jgi:tripeptidyl-peptidase-1
VITTGGGFSTIYEVPSWQEPVINAYFDNVENTDKKPFHGYNRRGRGFPDVSLLGHNYVITIGNNFTAVSGTSASAPVFAAYISLVNSERLKQSLPPLGWVNPAIYAFATSFINDITDGDNRCVALGTVCCAQGFMATTGW